jgi:hypothetical protein
MRLSERRASLITAFRLLFRAIISLIVKNMPVLEMQVNCCRKRHKIILWPNGRLTLASHQGKRARQTMAVAQAMGQKYRCAEILEAYRTVCAGRGWGEHRKSLPVQLRLIAEAAHKMQSGRYRHRWKESVDSLAHRQADRKSKMINDKVEEVTGERSIHMSPLRGMIDRTSVRFHEKESAWFKRAFLSGILRSELFMDGQKFFPMLIPEHVVRQGFGYVAAYNQKGEPYWIMIERSSEMEYLKSQKGERPNWRVMSFYEVTGV